MESELPYLAVPAQPGHPVLVLHSWWGLTRSFTDYADQLASAGFLAACADLYDGELATDEAQARALRSRPRRKSMSRTLLDNAGGLLAHPAADSDRVAVIGFSMGGHWAIWLAGSGRLPVSAAVVHYATRAFRAGAAAVPVLCHFAEEDPFVTTSGRRSMVRSLTTAGCPVQIAEHPGTGHWFAEAAESAYHPQEAAAAFDQTCAFLRRSAW